MAKSATVRRSAKLRPSAPKKKAITRVPLLRVLREMDLEDARRPASKSSEFTFIDLFAGIGGMRLGFEPIRGKCVFTCERDPYCQKTYAANFPNDDHA